MKEGKSEIQYPQIREGLSLEEFTPQERNILEFINQKVAAGNNLEEIIGFIFENTRDLFPCDRIGIAFMEEDGNRLSLYHVIADYEPVFLSSGYSADIRGSSLASIFNQGYPRIINDLQAYGREHTDSESTRLLLKEGILSSMTCPLKVEGRLAGVLFRSSKKANAYNDHMIRLQLSINERLGQAVEKAYRIEQLTEAIHSYMEMLGFVSHELKSPLASMITVAKTLTAGYYGPLAEKQKEMIERMIRKAEYLHNLSTEYLNLSRFESGMMQLRVREVDYLSMIIMPQMELLMPQIEEKRMRVEKDMPEGPILINCDPELLKIVVVNLLGNAVKYGDDGGEIRLSVRERDDKLITTVWNQGPGFSEEGRKRL